MADVVGRLKALTRLKTSRQRAALQAGRTAATLEVVETAAADLAEAKAQKTALTKAAEHAARAGLDPHRSKISLVQIYAGGGRVAVIDMRRVAVAVLAPLWEQLLVAHNAAFELGHLAAHGIEPIEMHCTLQAVRLLNGPDATPLASACATYFGIELPKDLQTSDWSAEHLTLPQIQYAASDAVVTWHLAETIFPLLGQRESAYAIQMSAMPAVVRMQLRGVLLDTVAHTALVAALQAKRTELAAVYCEECRKIGRTDLALEGVPGSIPAIEALLGTLLSEQERNGWPRTQKTGKLSAKRVDLASAADAYPQLKALVDLGRIDTQLNTFGTGLAAQVSPVTGRIHAAYKIAGAVSGRTSCKQPNMQQIPDEQRIPGLPSFRTLFVAKPGCTLIVADWASMEMRAAAYISGDATMTRAFERGEDLHRLTAATMLRVDPKNVTVEQRKHAKPVNFGRLYGQGAAGLTEAARSNYGIILDLHDGRRMDTRLSGDLSRLHSLVSPLRQGLRARRRNCDRPRGWARPRDPLEPGRLPLHAMPQSADPRHLRRHRHAGPGDDRSLALRGRHRRRASRLAARRDRAGSACRGGRQGSPTSS